MSTPVIEAINNVNQTSLNAVFAAVAADPTARDNLSQSDRNIDAVSTNVGVIESLNNNEEAIRKMLCRREGRDPANFADLNAVAADVSLVQDISVREAATDIITSANKAYNAISANDRAAREMMCNPAGLDATTFTDVSNVVSDSTAMATIAADAQASRAMAAVPLAMQEVAASQAARNEIIPSQIAMQAVAASQTAMQEVIASQTAIQEVVASQTAIQEVAASQTAMQEVAASQTAMQEVIASQIALDEVAGSQTAMQEVAGSQTAMQEVIGSQTALDAIGNNSVVQNTVYNNNTAISALNSSTLIQNLSAGISTTDDKTLKGDRVILLTHDEGALGFRTNQPQFGGDSDIFPHTADRIRRENSSDGSTNASTSASFIDISNS